MNKEFKSLHIDLENKIFLLNGERLDGVTKLRLEAEGKKWSLKINRDETYEAPVGRTKKSG